MKHANSRWYSTFTSALALVALVACSGKPEPKKATIKKVEPYIPSSVTKGDDKMVGKIGSLSTEIMQKTVARIVGFVDVDGKNVNIYQDAYSVVYNTAQNQKGRDVNVDPNPIYYYTPLFSAQEPKILQLPTGELNITIANKQTPERVRGRIQYKAAEGLKTYNITAASIGQVPLSEISATLQAFGKSYDVEMANDLSTASLKIALADIPASLFSGTGDKKVVDAAKFNALFSDQSTLSISYRYYVQKFSNTTCGLNIDSDFINKMFTDDEKCAKLPPLDKSSPTVAAILGKDPNSPLVQDPKFQGLEQLVASTSKVVGACLAATENKKLLARSSVRCVKPGGKDLSEDFKAFMDTVLKPVASTVANNYTADYPNWSKDMMVSAVKLFGSPENFRSEMNKFNDQFLNVNNKEARDVYMNDNSEFIKTINEHNKRTENTTGNSKSGGFGVSGPFGFGLNASGGGTDFKSDISDATDIIHQTNDNTKIATANEFLKQKGYNHQIANSQGKYYFYPSFDIKMKADVSDVQDKSSSMTNIDLGDVVAEKETTSAVLKKRPEASMVLQIYCADAGTTLNSSNAISSTAYLNEAEWWKDAQFFEITTKDISDKISGLACGQVAIGGYFTGLVDAKGAVIKDNSDLLPPDGIVINARVQGFGVNPTTKANQTESQINMISLRPGHTSGAPLIGNPMVISANGQAANIRFTTIKISK